MRTVLTGGHLLPKKPARKCFICESFYTARDERLASKGAQVSHGVCGEKCMEQWEREYLVPLEDA